VRFLLVEDNAQLAKAVVDRLALDGHVIDHAGDLATAQSFIDVTSYDLILLDIMLPDGDGRDFLTTHRRNADRTPVIVLTARSQISDRVGMLDLGADDYITKPFDFSELEARCRAVLRRQGGVANNLRHFAGVGFDSLSGTITIGASTESLRNREHRLLEIFFAHRADFFENPFDGSVVFLHRRRLGECNRGIYWPPSQKAGRVRCENRNGQGIRLSTD